MKSLKGTLFRGVILGILPVLLVAGCVLYFSVSAQLVKRMDESLSDKARMLSLSVERKPFGLEVDLEEMGAGDMETADSPEYLHVGTLDGRILYRSEALQGLPIPSFSGSPQDTRDWSVLPDGGRLRSVLFSFLPETDDEEELLEVLHGEEGLLIDTGTRPGEKIVLQLFRNASSHEHFMRVFLLMLLATGLGSIGILSLTVWLAIEKGADPINELASRIETIGEKDLTVRLEEESVMRELGPIAHTFNTFLNRLEESFDRERGFTSDAAHELRTPLAGLRTTIEVSLARERDGKEYRVVLGRALEIVRQLERLVTSLLALARLESGQEAGSSSQVNLPKVVEEMWGPFLVEAGAKGIEVSLNLGNGSMVSLDGEMLAQVLEELFRNAVYYTERGGSITVDLARGKGEMNLQIRNSGSRIGAQEADHVFDRFWRGSGARDDTGTRFGLGLPIVRKIVQTMGWDIGVQSEAGGEFVVTVIIPTGH